MINFEIVVGVLFILFFMGRININVCRVSDQIDALDVDIRKIKSDIEEIKKATGDNAFEAMLDKPIQPRYLSPEDLYRSYGWQIR